MYDLCNGNQWCVVNGILDKLIVSLSSLLAVFTDVESSTTGFPCGGNWNRNVSMQSNYKWNCTDDYII